MEARSAYKEEYEIVAYPKLHHVRSSIVQIVNRNTHIHQALELGLVLEGEATVHIGGKHFPIGRGTLFFFNANEPHEIIAASQSGVRIAYLQISSAFCREYLNCFRNLELLRNDLTGALTPAQTAELTGLLLDTLEDYMTAEEGDFHALRCICNICQLYAKLLEYVPYRKISESAYLSRNKKMARLSRITEYINNNYSEKITLEMLAKRENVTPTYLSHFIRDNLHMTFQEYISSVRFERALKLLRGTSMCLTDISVVSGFSDVKYLTRMLEKQFGTSARQCRTLLRSQLEPPVRKGQTQTFASEELARIWLEDFRKTLVV